MTKYIMLREPKPYEVTKTRVNSRVCGGVETIAIVSNRKLPIVLWIPYTINVACPHWGLVYTRDYFLDSTTAEHGRYTYKLVRTLQNGEIGYVYSTCRVKGLIVEQQRFDK